MGFHMRKADIIWISKLSVQVVFAAAIIFIVHLIDQSYSSRLEALERQNNLYEAIITSADVPAAEKSLGPSIKMIQDSLTSHSEHFSLNQYLFILIGVTIVGVTLVSMLNEKLREED